MNNSFLQQFSPNIKFKYFCFDRVIIRGYIRKLFFEAGIVLFLRAMGFRKLSNGVMRILTDPPASPERLAMAGRSAELSY